MPFRRGFSRRQNTHESSTRLKHSRHLRNIHNLGGGGGEGGGGRAYESCMEFLMILSLPSDLSVSLSLSLAVIFKSQYLNTFSSVSAVNHQRMICYCIAFKCSLRREGKLNMENNQIDWENV